MSAIQISIGGSPVDAVKWNFGTTAWGSGSATFDLRTGPTARPGDVIEFGDGGKTLWRGVVDRVETTRVGQIVHATDITAIAAVPASRAFRYGDVIRYRDRSADVRGHRYMVVKKRPGTKDEYEVIGLTEGIRGQGFDIGESDWELAE